MKIKYLGHSAFAIEMNGKNIIVDPFINDNPLVNNIKVEELKADYILLTHGHFDHVADAEAIANANGATIVSNYEIVSWYNEKGITGHPLNHGGKVTFDFGTVKYVNAVHSSVLPDGTYGGNPGGFVIWDDKHCLYIAGDTALTKDMELIPQTCPRLTAAILPIGDNFTMDYHDALLASRMIECQNIIGCHYDTFGYIKIDHQEAVSHFANGGATLSLLEIGEETKL